jgi:hydrogenase expression/formation protein HypE
MQAAALEAGVMIVACDTKVVQKGKADGLYINTAGFGRIRPGVNISGANARPGDVVIVSGPIGDHGIAVLEARGELGFETGLKSDVAPLNHLVSAMLHTTSDVHVMRDPTRGGLATTLNEIAQQSGVCIELDEASIPVRPPVQAACEMLGFDPLYIANEGKLVAIVAPAQAERLLETMRSTRYGEESVVVGRVTDQAIGRVLIHTTLGTTRILDMLAGEILPRIC